MVSDRQPQVYLQQESEGLALQTPTTCSLLGSAIEAALQLCFPCIWGENA